MKIKFKRLDHIQICIPAGKEDEARKFYTDILGLEEIEKPDSLKSSGGLWYNLGNIELHIGIEEIKNNNSKRHPAFEVENIIGAKKFLNEQGIKIKDDISIPGSKDFLFMILLETESNCWKEKLKYKNGSFI